MRRTPRRAWWLVAVGLCLSLAAPALAATRVTIHELKERPLAYIGQQVQLECYFDKESPIWVNALPQPDAWVGFFVTGNPEQSVSWSGEYYNLLFAPKALEDAIRTLRGGDKVTIVGEGFAYPSTTFSGVAIQVQEIMKGWGASASAIGAAEAPATSPPAATDPGLVTIGQLERSMAQTARGGEKYTVTINGKRYEGLRVGDRYNFDGVDFAVEPVQ